MWCFEIRKHVSLFRSQNVELQLTLKKKGNFINASNTFVARKHKNTWLGSRHFPFPEVAPHSAKLQSLWSRKVGMFFHHICQRWIACGWKNIPTVGIWHQVFWNWSSLNICQLLIQAWVFDQKKPMTHHFFWNRSISAPGHEKIQQVICKSLNIVPCHSVPFSSCSLWGGSWICWPFHHWQRRRYMNCLGCIHRQSYFKVNVVYNGQPANRIWKSNMFESTLQEQLCPGDIRTASTHRIWIICNYMMNIPSAFPNPLWYRNLHQRNICKGCIQEDSAWCKWSFQDNNMWCGKHSKCIPWLTMVIYGAGILAKVVCKVASMWTVDSPGRYEKFPLLGLQLSYKYSILDVHAHCYWEWPENGWSNTDASRFYLHGIFYL